MSHNVTLIPGDGVGPEIADATKKVLDATGVEFNWDIQDAGTDVFESEGTPLPDRVLASIRKNKLAIKGPVTTPVGTGFRSVNVTLRQELDLYACLRPCVSFKGTRSRYEDIDIVLVRENTEDLYAGIENERATKVVAVKRAVKKERSGRDLSHNSRISINAQSAEGS